MTVLAAVLVAAGGAVGAPARYLLDRAVQAWHGGAYPWGTWVVNVLGSLVLGVVAAAGSAGALPPAAVAAAGFGFCGAFTTYSTFSYETVRLLLDRRWWLALANVGGSVVAALAAVTAGYTVTAALLL